MRKNDNFDLSLKAIRKLRKSINAVYGNKKIMRYAAALFKEEKREILKHYGQESNIRK